MRARRSDAKVARLLASLRPAAEAIREYLPLILFTGLRRSARLTWADVDLGARIVSPSSPFAAHPDDGRVKGEVEIPARPAETAPNLSRRAQPLFCKAFPQRGRQLGNRPGRPNTANPGSSASRLDLRPDLLPGSPSVPWKSVLLRSAEGGRKPFTLHPSQPQARPSLNRDGQFSRWRKALPISHRVRYFVPMDGGAGSCQFPLKT
jgi:hypothetical protein